MYLKAESSKLHNSIEPNALYMGRERIYFAPHSFRDKTSFDDNAIWLLSEDIIFSISTERRPITADLMKASACVRARWRACLCASEYELYTLVASERQLSANSEDVLM